LDYATAERLPSGEYQINVGDTASRYTTNTFKTSPGAAPPPWQARLAAEFGPNGNFSLPDPVIEQGLRDAFNAGRISNVQIDTVDFSPQGQGRLTVNGAAVPIDPVNPTPIDGAWSQIGHSAVGGAALGGGISLGINAIQIIANPDAHPDAPRELATTGFLGTAGGGAGAAVDAAVTPVLGPVLGGGLGGGIAAPLVTLGGMALSDQQYSAEDYEAKGARSAVSGALSGALAAGVVGAVGLSEVPILGTAVGFVVGFGGYLAFDALFGDDVENAVRGLNHLPDPSSFMSPPGAFFAPF
jgi:hypothetical protein